MAYAHTMVLFRSISIRYGAGAMLLAVGLVGSASATSTTTTQKSSQTQPAHHSTAKHTHSSSSHKASAHHTSYSAHNHKSKHHHSTITGQKVMDASRATEIQQALIQAHYLSGAPTGQWDADSQAAMVKFQSDNGWQSKITPDSRALIKLGLGPKQDAGEYAAHPTETSAVSTGSAGSSTGSIGTMATSEHPLSTPSN